jgi:hypothetical protein
MPQGDVIRAAVANGIGGELPQERVERTLGAEHPDTLTSRNNLAGVLSRQGELQQAAEPYRAVLEILERTLGAEHPDTLTTRHALANVLSRKRDSQQTRDTGVSGAE